MNLVVKAVLAFSILMILTSEAYSICYSRERSYRWHVLKSDIYVGNKKMEEAESALEKHLKCYPEREVFIKLAKLYESQEKYYLAGLTYKKAGMEKEYLEIEKIRVSHLNSTVIGNFNQKMNKKRVDLNRYGRGIKYLGASTFFTVGAALALTGGGFFIQNKAFDGKNSELIQYSLLIGGFSFIASGFSINVKGDYFINSSISLRKALDNKLIDNGTTPDEYFVYYGAERNAKKMTAKSLKVMGACVLASSVPLLIFTMFSIFDEYRNTFSGNDESAMSSGIENIIYYPMKILLVPPVLLIVIRGIVMLAKASKWEKLNTEPDILTLTSITPIINPVSKTYGLALGFSF